MDESLVVTKNADRMLIPIAGSRSLRDFLDEKAMQKGVSRSTLVKFAIQKVFGIWPEHRHEVTRTYRRQKKLSKGAS